MTKEEIMKAFTPKECATQWEFDAMMAEINDAQAKDLLPLEDRIEELNHKKTMESVKIKVTRRNGETIVKSDKGQEFKFGGKMLSETVIASLVFQTVYLNFEKLRNVSENFEISLTMDYTVHQDEPQADKGR